MNISKFKHSRWWKLSLFLSVDWSIHFVFGDMIYFMDVPSQDRSKAWLNIFKCSISYLHSLHNMRIANILRFLGSVSRCFWWFMFSFARFALTAFIFSSMSCRRRPAWYSWVRRSARRIGVCLQLNLALILLSIWCHVSNKSMMIKYFSKDSAILIHKLCFRTTSTIQQHPTHLARSWFFTELVHIR